VIFGRIHSGHWKVLWWKASRPSVLARGSDLSI